MPDQAPQLHGVAEAAADASPLTGRHCRNRSGLSSSPRSTPLVGDPLTSYNGLYLSTCTQPAQDGHRGLALDSCLESSGCPNRVRQTIMQCAVRSFNPSPMRSCSGGEAVVRSRVNGSTLQWQAPRRGLCLARSLHASSPPACAAHGWRKPSASDLSRQGYLV